MNEPVDVLIVGSGPVGAAFARTIRDLDPDARILMVEAGPVVSQPRGRHVKTLGDPALIAAAQLASQGKASNAYAASSPLARANGEQIEILARPGTYLVDEGAVASDDMPAAAMSMNVGGMGAHWTGACPLPGDGERITEIPRAEFDELLARAWELLGVTQHAFDGAPLGAEVRQILGDELDEGRPADRRVQPMPLAVRVAETGELYWSGSDVVLGALAEHDDERFELRAETVATRLIQDGSRITGVELLDRRSGTRSTVDVSHVVVAADSLRTPQLLHASGIRPPALGHHLNEHPQVVGLARLDDRFVPADAKHSAPGTVDPLSGVNWIPYDRETLPLHGQIMQLDTSPVPLPDDAETWPGSIVGLGFFSAKEVRFEDRVEFDDDDLDEFGLPTMSVHYGLTDRDRSMIELMVATVERLAGVLGGLVGGYPPVVMPAGSSMHYMGTYRLGAEDDGTNVTDPWGRVWGFDNLHLGGNGIIPSQMVGNSTSLAVAVAVRSARSIVEGKAR